ncbi:MAG: cytochrome b N-terminal domain-containing protein, partial [Deltaproteobacteria bacterium]|nr:cytochrome b N-terminal domain-containing protein [Deltaproteobacteria bacterium]
MNARKLSSRLYGFGGMAFIVLLAQSMAGLYLAMFYQPVPAEAWKSIEFIETGLRAGGFARSLHRWGAFVLMLFLFLHLLIGMCRSAFRPTRSINWLTGLPLLPLMAALVLTGYLLPWDFRAYWSVLTMGNWLDKLPFMDDALRWLLFEDTPQGLVPLSRWFVLHAAVLPLLGGLALTLHLRAARRRL